MELARQKIKRARLYTAKAVKRHLNSAKEVVSFAVSLCTVSESKKKKCLLFELCTGRVLAQYYLIFTARCYASAVGPTSHGPMSVRLSVRHKSELY